MEAFYERWNEEYLRYIRNRPFPNTLFQTLLQRNHCGGYWREALDLRGGRNL
jgi:hypothetical protein